MGPNRPKRVPTCWCTDHFTNDCGSPNGQRGKLLKRMKQRRLTLCGTKDGDNVMRKSGIVQTPVRGLLSSRLWDVRTKGRGRKETLARLPQRTYVSVREVCLSELFPLIRRRSTIAREELIAPLIPFVLDELNECKWDVLAERTRIATKGAKALIRLER